MLCRNLFLNNHLIFFPISDQPTASFSLRPHPSPSSSQCCLLTTRHRAAFDISSCKNALLDVMLCNTQKQLPSHTAQYKLHKALLLGASTQTSAMRKMGRYSKTFSLRNTDFYSALQLHFQDQVWENKCSASHLLCVMVYACSPTKQLLKHQLFPEGFNTSQWEGNIRAATWKGTTRARTNGRPSLCPAHWGRTEGKSFLPSTRHVVCV